MSTTEKMVIIYSQKGWIKLTSIFNSSIFLPFECKVILDLINSAESHQTTSRGEHLLYFESVNTASRDVQLLLYTANNYIDSDEFIVHIIYDIGSEACFGNYYNNSFSLSVERQFSWADANTMKGQPLSISNPLPPKPNAIVIKDDHTCTMCGNTKCSKQEKSCWKCGSSI